MHITLLRLKKAPCKCGLTYSLDIHACISPLTSTNIIFSKAHDMQCSHTRNLRFIEQLLHTFSLACPQIPVTQADNNNPSNIEKKISSVRPKPLKRKKENKKSLTSLALRHSEPRIC